MNFSIRFFTTVLISAVVLLFCSFSPTKNKPGHQPQDPKKTEIKIIKKSKDTIQNGLVKIKGRLYFSKTGETAIGGIVIANKNFGAYADDNGNFKFECPPGELNLEAKYIGYDNGKLIIQGKQDEIIELKIYFNKSSIPLKYPNRLRPK